MIFDARPDYNPENKRYLATKGLSRKIISKIWDCPKWLDQDGNHGCAMYGTAHNLVALRPGISMTEQRVKTYYRETLATDEYPGQADTGTSVVSCMKTLMRRGLIKGFEHVFTMTQLKQVLSHKGPVVLTCPMHAKMTEPNKETGLVKVGGKVQGWHAMLIRGQILDAEVFRLRQSGGRGYGLEGDIFITFAGMEYLLKEGSTLCAARI